jgi:predicted ATPase
MNPTLISAHIENYKSLGSIDLNFKDLTIIVGANSSGKSSCLESLSILRNLVREGSTPPLRWLDEMQKVGTNEDIKLMITLKEAKKQAEYRVSIAKNAEVDSDKSQIYQETLTVGKTKVIDIKNGAGKVRDEDGKNIQDYQSKPENLALKFAGNFGKKPVTSHLAEFMIRWEFYNLDPDYIRENDERLFSSEKTVNSLDRYGLKVQDLLKHWYVEQREKFEEINQDIENYLNIKLKLLRQDEKSILKVIEPDGSEVGFSNLSDGTLRIIAYCTLLHIPEGPTLIGIEEPERNLHPGILKDIATIIKRLSQKMQVVITTHSSQLLDCFTLEDINSDVSVILLKKSRSAGTEAFQLENLSKDCEDLSEWMADFGVGSAIYHSNLLQEILNS